MGRHVVVLVVLVVIIVVVIVRRLRRRIPRESIPLLPTTEPFQGVPSPRPLAGPSLLRVLFLLLLSCSAQLGPPRPPGPVVGKACETLPPGDRRKVSAVRTKGNPTQGERRSGHSPGTHTRGRDASRAATSWRQTKSLGCENQGQSDARRKKERTLTRDTHPWSGRIKG